MFLSLILKLTLDILDEGHIGVRRVIVFSIWGVQILIILLTAILDDKGMTKTRASATNHIRPHQVDIFMQDRF